MKYIKKIINIVHILWIFLEKIPVFLEASAEKFSKSKIYLLLNIIVIGSILFHYIFHPIQVEKEQAKLLVRYQDNNNGTITDRENRLQWMQCNLGQKWNKETCVVELSTSKTFFSVYTDSYRTSGKEYTWEKAVDVARNIDYAGYSDWRLPTIKELKSLVYCSNGQPSLKVSLKTVCSGNYSRPAIDHSLFPNTGKGDYWSSSSFSYLNKNKNWCIDFGKGRRIVCEKQSPYSDTPSRNFVRLVRDL